MDIFPLTPHIKSIINEKTSTAHHNKFQKQVLRKKTQRKTKKAIITQQKQKKTDLVYQLHRTICHHFPQLFEWMKEIDDCRKKASHYELTTHLMACL